MIVLLRAVLVFFCVVLFMRLYLFNQRFYRTINTLIEKLEALYSGIWENRQKSMMGLIKFLGLVLVILLALFYTLGMDAVLGVLGIAAMILLFLPLYMSEQTKTKAQQLDQLSKHIATGEVSDASITQLKQAIKSHYALRYAPKKEKPKSSKPTFFDRIIVGFVYLLFPKLLIRRSIFFITSIPLFRSLFQDYPYHARYSPYFAVLDTLQHLSLHHPYRLLLKNVVVNDLLVTYVFRDKDDHSLHRARLLARQVELEHDLPEESVMVHASDDEIHMRVMAQDIQET